MSSLAAATASDDQPRRLTVSAVIAAWRGITRQQVLTTFLLGCAMFLYRAAVTINVHFAPFIFVGDQLKAFALLLTIAVADRVTGKDPDRKGAYVLALIIGAALIVPVTGVTVWSLIRLLTNVASATPPAIGFLLNIYFELLMVGGATIWVINDRRRARRERGRRHAAELQRIAAEKQSIESDLQAMQARIEPQFLFDTLTQVNILYARDHSAGERLLDALIAYLRAAMPKMRETSTVGHELALVRAYLSIKRLRMGERLSFSADPLDSRIANAPMPAMILLPLIDHATAHGPTEWPGNGSILIRATAIDGGIRLEVACVGMDLTTDVEGGSIGGVRGRLALLYGRTASLEIERRQAGESVAVLRIPDA
jgi:hypothetical protein